ncbi:MAG TPA: hypothetical protein VF771_14990 [Longimicrobiaceae bacterium]
MNPRLPGASATAREPIPLSAYSREVHGYHGCDRAIADRLLSGDPFVPSTNAWDWLGDGIYFWEYGPDRALRWAEQQSLRSRVKKPAVVGAIIQLGRCLDLLDTRFTAALRLFYNVWAERMRADGNVPMTNRGKARYLDRAVIEAYIQHSSDVGTVYDTVRGAFVEGEPVYPGSALYTETHIQIAVRNRESIVGVYRPAFAGIR